MIRNIINRIVKQIKGGNYQLSEKIPLQYLLNLAIVKITHRLYAIIRLRKLKTAFISPSCILKATSLLSFENKLIIGRKCYIDALGEIGIKCGNNVSFGQNTTMIVTGSLKQIGKGIIIGNNVGLGTNGYYGGAGGVEIGDDTIFGNFVSIHPENHNYDILGVPIRLQGVNHKGIKIGNGCWIGAKATILDGTRIGDGCIVAAGAVVRGEFPDNVIIGGVPAKIIKNRR